MLAVARLSEETSDIIEAQDASIPERHLATVFHRYIRGERDPIETPRLIPEGPSPSAPIDLLLWLTDQTKQHIVAKISEQHGAVLEKLAGAAGHFASMLPRHRFGGYLCARAAMYLCLHDANEATWRKYREVLETYASRSLAEYVALLGTGVVVAAVKSLPDRLDGPSDDYAACLIDHLRSQNAVDRIHSDAKRLQSAGRLTSIACAFSIATQRPDETKHFAKSLVNSLRRDEDGRLLGWVARNPVVLEVLRYHSIPPRMATKLSIAAASEGAYSVSALIQWLLQEGNEDPKLTLAILEELGTQPSYSNEVSLALRHVLGLGEMDLPSLLRSKKLNYAVVNNLLWIAPFLPNERCDQLFEALRPIPPQTSRQLIHSALSSEHTEWAIDRLIPLLIEDDAESTRELANIRDKTIASRLISRLAKAWNCNATGLASYEREWHSARDRQKKEVTERVFSSLAATRPLSMPELSNRLGRVSDEIATWLSQDTPPFKAVTERRWRIRTNFPTDIDMKRISDASDFVSAIALMPELIAQFGESSTARFPSVHSALEVVAREYAVSAKAWRKAQTELVRLPETVAIDLAIKIRQLVEDLEVSLTPHFLFRSALQAMGLKMVATSLAEKIDESSLSSRVHKIHRDADRTGQLRAFSLGIQVGKDVVGSVVVMKSGDPDDRD